MGIAKKILFIIIIIFVQSYSLFSVEKPRVAVMPFSAGSGISRSEARFLTEMVRVALIETRRYIVISNDQMNIMLKTKALKQKIGSGSCTSEKCVIDLGNALECEKMIVGRAAGAFGQYSISVKMLDVVKQKYEKGKQFTIQNKKQFPKAAIKIVDLLIKDNTVSLDDARYTGYVSVGTAMGVSLLPVWSGSWNAGYTGWGTVFVIGKVIGAYYLYKTLSMVAPDYYDPKYASDPSSYNKDIDEYYYEEERASLFALYLILPFTLADIIYSGFRVYYYNKKYGLTANNNISPGDIYFDINPRIGTYSSKGPNPNAIEGINLSVAYRF